MQNHQQVVISLHGALSPGLVPQPSGDFLGQLPTNRQQFPHVRLLEEE
jgi:hypothetical protein